MKVDAGTLVRASSVALWQQLSDLLRRQIHVGTFRPGARMPSEPELCALYEVSRITVRAAVDQLLAERLVVRKQGKGTFVAVTKMRQDLSDLAGIIPNLEAQGVRFETRLVSFAQAPAPPEIAATLGSGSGAVLQFRRLYEMAGTPFGLCEVWIPDATKVTREQAEEAPCYTILSRHLDRPAARARLIIRLRRPDRCLAQLLTIRRGESLLCLERVSFTAAGRACETTCFWVRPDQYEFGLDVEGPMPIATGLKRIS